MGVGLAAGLHRGCDAFRSARRHDRRPARLALSPRPERLRQTTAPRAHVRPSAHCDSWRAGATMSEISKSLYMLHLEDHGESHWQ